MPRSFLAESLTQGSQLGAIVLNVSFFGGRVPNPTKIDYRKKVGTLVLTSLLEDPKTETHHPLGLAYLGNEPSGAM